MFQCFFLPAKELQAPASLVQQPTQLTHCHLRGRAWGWQGQGKLHVAPHTPRTHCMAIYLLLVSCLCYHALQNVSQRLCITTGLKAQLGGSSASNGWIAASLLVSQAGGFTAT